MPYPLETTQGEIADVADTMKARLPAYALDDLIIIRLQQDTGSTVISTAASGWALIQDSQSQVNGQRYVEFYKVMDGLIETEVEFTGRLETWVWSVVCYRDVDTVNPINAKARASFNASATHDSPTITTTVDNCLICYSWGTDQANFMQPTPLESLTHSATQQTSGNGALSGYKVQYAQGLTDVVTIQHESTSEGGECHVVAIAPASGSIALPPEVDNLFQVGASYSKTDVQLSATDPSLVLTTINGLTVSSGVDAFEFIDFPDPYSNLTSTRLTVNTSLADRWAGSLHTLNNTLDFSNKYCSLEFRLVNFKANRIGSGGAIAVFMDSVNNWTAIQLASVSNAVEGGVEVRMFDLAATNFYDQSTIAPDLTDINKVAFLCHRVGSTTNNSTVYVRNLLLTDSSVLIGGSAEAPISPALFSRLLSGWGFIDRGKKQGSGQGEVAIGIQLGNGADLTYTDFSAASYETALISLRNTIERYNCPLEIHSSDLDTTNFTSCIIRANTAQKLSYNPASSLLSSETWAGASVVGWEVSGLSGKTYDGASFTDCTIDQNGSAIGGCSMVNSPVDSNNPAVISKSTFDSDSPINITVAGTYSMTDVTIETVTNSSGGNVTLNLSGSSVINNNGGPNISIVSSSTLSFSVKDQAGLSIESAFVYIDEDNTAPILHQGQTDASGIASFSHTTGAATGSTWRVRKYGYKPSKTIVDIGAAHISLPVTLIADPQQV